METEGWYIFAVAIAFFIALWVYKDARRRNKGRFVAFLWFLGVWMLMIVFLPLWFLCRPRVLLCPHCGKYYEGTPSYCPHCGGKLR